MEQDEAWERRSGNLNFEGIHVSVTEGFVGSGNHGSFLSIVVAALTLEAFEFTTFAR